MTKITTSISELKFMNTGYIYNVERVKLFYVITVSRHMIAIAGNFSEFVSHCPISSHRVPIDITKTHNLR